MVLLPPNRQLALVVTLTGARVELRDGAGFEDRLRRAWRLSPASARAVQLLIGVYAGRVVAVRAVTGYVQDGSFTNDSGKVFSRWAFETATAPRAAEQLLGTAMPSPTRNPVRLLPLHKVLDDGDPTPETEPGAYGTNPEEVHLVPVHFGREVSDTAGGSDSVEAVVVHAGLMPAPPKPRVTLRGFVLEVDPGTGDATLFVPSGAAVRMVTPGRRARTDGPS